MVDRRTLLKGGAAALTAAAAPVWGAALGTAAAKLDGLSAPRSIRSKVSDRWSIRDFGDINAGQSDTPASEDYGPIFRKALASGERLYIPPGFYPLRELETTESCVELTNDISIDVDCADGATIHSGSELAGTASTLLRAVNSATTPAENYTFTWRGGYFDLTEGTAASNNNGIALYQYNKVLFDSVIFDGGTSTPTSEAEWGYGNSDTAIVSRANHTVIRGCKFIGFWDLAVYFSGNNNGDVIDLISEGFLLEGCWFYRCGNAASGKRSSLEHIMRDNRLYECVNGFRGGTADGITDNEGRGWTVSGNRMQRMQGRPISVPWGDGDVVSNNRIVDFGCLLSDHTTQTGVAVNNNIGAIALNGGSGCVVEGNTIFYKDFNLVTFTAGKQPVGVYAQQSNDGTTYSFDNLITGNVFRDLPYRAWLERTGSDRNRFHGNIEVNCGEASVLTGANSSRDYVPNPHFKASPGSAQTVPAATLTTLVLGTEDIDVGGYYDNTSYQWTPPAGRFLMRAVARIDSGIVAGETITIGIYRNTSSSRAIKALTPQNTGIVTLEVELEETSDGTNTYEARLVLNGAGDKTVNGSGVNTYLTGRMI